MLSAFVILFYRSLRRTLVQQQSIQFLFIPRKDHQGAKRQSFSCRLIFFAYLREIISLHSMALQKLSMHFPLFLYQTFH